MAFGRHGDHYEVELADLGDGPEGASVVLRRNLRRAIAVDVDDAGERDAGQRRENPRVMLAEMTDADTAAFMTRLRRLRACGASARHRPQPRCPPRWRT